MAKNIIKVQDIKITLFPRGNEDYISLTDMAKGFGTPSAMLDNWIRSRSTLNFLGFWEMAHNPNFDTVGFDDIMRVAGDNTFYMSVGQWIERTAAVGFTTRKGRSGGTYSHKDIAMQFAMWLSPQFQVFLIKEFDRLKHEEYHRLKDGWNLKRELSKINYKIHTDAVKDMLVPPEVQHTDLASPIYANEADVLNKALFGMTAAEWREQNPDKDGNIRDHATHAQLILLINIQSINAEYMRLGVPQHERIYRLNEVVRNQMQSLLSKQKKIDELSSGGKKLLK